MFRLSWLVPPAAVRDAAVRVAALAVVALVTFTSLSAQSLQSEYPRMPDGKPNMTGLWQTLGTAHWDIQDHSASEGHFFEMGAMGAIPAGQGIVVGNDIPYLPEALAQKQDNFENRLENDPVLKCFMPGVPRATYMPFPFQIVQGTDQILIAYEFATANRIVRVDSDSVSPVDGWMGWSNAVWDGDTLEVDVSGLLGDAWFDHVGNYSTNQLHVVERYTMVSPNHIEYEAMIEDPNVYSEPWTIRLPLYRRIENQAKLLEFKCVEFTEEKLYGDLRRQEDE
jgi:hypothetical protein